MKRSTKILIAAGLAALVGVGYALKKAATVEGIVTTSHLHTPVHDDKRDFVMKDGEPWFHFYVGRESYFIRGSLEELKRYREEIRAGADARVLEGFWTEEQQGLDKFCTSATEVSRYQVTIDGYFEEKSQ